MVRAFQCMVNSLMLRFYPDEVRPATPIIKNKNQLEKNNKNKNKGLLKWIARFMFYNADSLIFTFSTGKVDKNIYIFLNSFIL